MGMMFILALMTSLTVQAAADKTALTTAIGEAETYYNTIQALTTAPETSAEQEF